MATVGVKELVRTQGSHERRLSQLNAVRFNERVETWRDDSKPAVARIAHGSHIGLFVRCRHTNVSHVTNSGSRKLFVRFSKVLFRYSVPHLAPRNTRDYGDRAYTSGATNE